MLLLLFLITLNLTCNLRWQVSAKYSFIQYNRSMKWCSNHINFIAAVCFSCLPDSPMLTKHLDCYKEFNFPCVHECCFTLFYWYMCYVYTHHVSYFKLSHSYICKVKIVASLSSLLCPHADSHAPCPFGHKSRFR